MRACPESTSWTQYKVAQAYVVMFKPWSNENCTEACFICIWHPGANEVKELEQSASVSLSVAYALRCPWPTILSCSPLVHEGSPKCSMGDYSHPQPPGLIKARQGIPNNWWGIKNSLLKVQGWQRGTCSEWTMNPYCTATWISSKLAWSVQAEAPVQSSSVHHRAGESQGLLLGSACCWRGSNPSGLKAPGSCHVLMMSIDHVEKFPAAHQSSWNWAVR